MSASSRRRAGWLAVILLDLLVAALVARQIVACREYVFDGDEATHANAGLALALDLRAGDWAAFAVDSYRQDMYPPAFAWLQALAFLIFGASPLVARLCSLACAFAAALFVYALGLELDETWGWLAGLAAAGMTLTAQTILVSSAMVMLEAPGLLASLATLWADVRAVKRPTAARCIITSLLMALTVLVKYPYGVVVVPAIGLAELLAALPFSPAARRAGTARRWLCLFGPLILAMLAWFVGPGKVQAFLHYATLQPSQVELFSLENLVYYPRSIALHFVPSPIWALLVLAGLAWAAARWRDERLRLLLVYFVLGLLVMTVKLQKNPRFIVTIVPAAHLLAGALVAGLAARWPAAGARARAAIGGVAAALLVIAAPALAERLVAYPALMQVEYETDARAADLAEWIAAQVPAGQRVYLINPWDQFSAPALQWRLATRAAPPGVRLSDSSVPSRLLKQAKDKNMQELQHAIRASGARYVVVLEGGPDGLPVWSDYAGAMAAMLTPLGQSEFTLGQWRPGTLQKLNRLWLTRGELERAQANAHYELDIQAVVYGVN